MIDNRRDAEDHITDSLGAFAEDHDVTAIADDLRESAGNWDVAAVDEDTFWAIVADHALIAA